MKYVKENIQFIYLITAIVGSIIAIIGDFLIGYMTSETIGRYGFIQTGWAELTEWRLSLSLFFASISFVLYLLGIYIIKQQITKTSVKTAKLFYPAAKGAIVGGLYIHVLFCAPMFAYQYLYNVGQKEMAFDLAYSIIFMMLPGAIITLSLMLFAFIVLLVATIRKKLIYSRWSVFLNPLVVMLIVMSAKLIFPSSALALAISTTCVNAGLMVFFINALIYEYKLKSKNI